VTVPEGQNARNFDPGTRAILTELRDLRVEMRADRRHADAEAAADRRRAEADRHRSDERFEQLIHEFRQDSARHHAETHQAFKKIRPVGLAIVKTLNRHTRFLERHTRLLERIDRKLGAWGDGRPGHGNARGG
jgi:hypothetical protein